MPNRILREGILTSERINSLKEHSELFYRRLMSVVDDFGRFDGRPEVLRVACYPLKVDCVRGADISRFLAEVQGAGLIVLYEVDGKAFLQMQDFRQQVRATASKYPAPDIPLLRARVAEDRRLHTKTESDTKSDTKSKTETGGSVFFWEIVPAKFRANSEVKSAWEKWVKDKSDRGRPINCNSAREQFLELETWPVEEVVLSLKNAVKSGHSRPFRPDAPKNGIKPQSVKSLPGPAEYEPQ